MRRSWTGPLVVLAIIAAIALSWALFASSESRRAQEVHNIRNSHSELHLAMIQEHAKGPVAREEWRMNDVDGRSTAVYSVTDREGRTERVDATMQTYDVSFLFGKVVQDGIWDLTNKPPRGDTSTQYRISIAQTVNGQSGSRVIAFTDPHYWATTAGHQFQITLDKNKPVPDLLKMKSTVLADPRYQQVVSDISDFGSPKFRSTVVEARAKLHLPS